VVALDALHARARDSLAFWYGERTELPRGTYAGTQPRAGGSNELIQPPAPRLVSNDMSSLKRAAIEGVGIVALPATFAERAAHWRLTQVLRGWFR